MSLLDGSVRVVALWLYALAAVLPAFLGASAIYGVLRLLRR